MEKENIEDFSNKKNSKKKKKVTKYILIGVILLVIIALVSLLIVYILLNDHNKNTHKDNSNDSSEIIKKNFIDGFSSTSSSGVFSFSLPKDDVNQMLMNAYKKMGDTSIEGIYYEDQGEKQYFYVDLPRGFIPTTVVVETYVSSVDSFTYELKINNVSKGKINIVDKAISKGYLTSEYISKIAANSLLPISYDESNKTFKVNVLSFMEYFPSSHLKEAIFGYISQNNDTYFSLGASLFSFNIDFTKLRDNSFMASKDITGVEDMPTSLVSALNSVDVSTLPIGGEKDAYEISELAFSNIVSSSLNVLPIETFESSLTSNKAIFKVSYVHTIFESNHIKYVFDLSIAGYEININLDSEVVATYPLYRTYLKDNDKVSVASIEIDSSLDLGKLFKSYLSLLHENLSSKYVYLTYFKDSNIFGFDFSFIETQLSRPDIIPSKLNVKPAKLGFIVQRAF